MISETLLTIRLTREPISARRDQPAINQIRGGPESLLAWLETQFGLPAASPHPAARINEFANLLDQADPCVFSASLKVDRWATADELLSRRDELLLAGWDGSESASLPVVVRDLARVMAQRKLTFPSEAERLRRVQMAFEDGQILPPHVCHLHDPIDQWPACWQDILESMNTDASSEIEPHASDGSALKQIQTMVRGGEGSKQVEQDTSFRHVQTRSAAAAVELVVSALANAPDGLATTVICCEDDLLALRLDACLTRAGLPTAGASTRTTAHPVLQILPLALALCWEPIDPQVVLDFLTLPILPLPRRVASDLAAALTDQPGLGSRAWTAKLETLCNEENDPEGHRAERIQIWLEPDRATRGEAISAQLVRRRCAQVAQWLAGRATQLAKDEQPRLDMIDALHRAAQQASLLADLAENQGKHITEPQLARLLEEAVGSGVRTAAAREMVGGPRRVRSLAEIDEPCDRLIWLGLATANPGGCRWSTDQLRALRASGLDLDDGSKALSSMRAAESRGFARVKQDFLAVLVPQDHDQRWHPIWLAVRGSLSDEAIEQPLVFEDLAIAGDHQALSPFNFDTHELAIEPPQTSRPLWQVPAELVVQRDSVSATSLEARLACPLKWTLRYQAELYSSRVAELPTGFLLKGIFGHSVLEHVLARQETLDDVSGTVDEVLEEFDQRVPLDAAPLAQPNQQFGREQLRGELANATQVLLEALNAGGYQIFAMETEPTGQFEGKPLKGWIDCLVRRDDGQEAIVDFKYGGKSKYYKMIKDGNAVQLATYAYGRSRETGQYPAVAYLILSEGLLYTPEDGAIEGATRQASISGDPIHVVWNKFAAALSAADGWGTGREAVPARPLQHPSDWPTDLSLVLDEKLAAGRFQSVCLYCDYKALCGIEEMS